MLSREDPNQMHKKKGAINGGFYKYKKGPYGNASHLVISVDNLEKHMEIVKKAGGKIQGRPVGVPGVGKFVMFRDSEGNRVGMLRPSR